MVTDILCLGALALFASGVALILGARHASAGSHTDEAEATAGAGGDGGPG